MKTFLSPFTPEQEIDCLKKIKSGDLEAKKELILRNMRLVAHVAKKYQNSEEDMEDLISIGTIGLIKAISTYKEDYGSRLATYAARCIDNAILSQMRLWFRISNIKIMRKFRLHRTGFADVIAIYGFVEEIFQRQLNVYRKKAGV